VRRHCLSIGLIILMRSLVRWCDASMVHGRSIVICLGFINLIGRIDRAEIFCGVLFVRAFLFCFS